MLATYDGEVIERIVSAVVYLVIPVVGIVWFNWDWRSIIVLYWLQNITIGVRTELDMLRTQAPPNPNFQSSFTLNGREMPKNVKKPFAMFFFAMHYGLFTLVHGIFVMLIAYGAFSWLFADAAAPSELGTFDLQGVVSFWAVASLIQITVGCFAPRAGLPPVLSLFWAPYPRIFVLHLTILLGVWLINYFGWPPVAALLLVALQFVVDVGQPVLAKRRGKPQQPRWPAHTA